MDVELTVQTRNAAGRGAVRKLRREERVPAVLYGPNTEPLALSVGSRRLEKLIKDMGEESKLVRLVIDDGVSQQTRQVLLREIQIHPTRRRFLHIDFYEVPLDQTTEFDVPIEVLGDAIGVKKGGVVDIIRRTLTVRCLPGEIPDKISIDISALDIGSSVHVSDLIGTVSYELADDPSYAVLHVTPPEGAGDEKDSEG